MILINNNWEQIDDLHDVSKIIREYYNSALADEMDKLIPEHTDIQYNGLVWELREKEDEISDLEDENDWLQSMIERLEEKVKKVKNKIKRNRKFNS